MCFVFESIVCVSFWRDAGIFRRVLSELADYFSLTHVCFRRKHQSLPLQTSALSAIHFSASQSSHEMDTFKGRSCLKDNRHQITTELASSPQAKWSVVSVRWPLYRMPGARR